MPARILDHWLKTQLLEQVPMCIAAIDRDYTIVEANQHFKERFGEWEGQKCYQAQKGFSASCPDCAATLTFRELHAVLQRIHCQYRYGSRHFSKEMLKKENHRRFTVEKFLP